MTRKSREELYATLLAVVVIACLLLSIASDDGRGPLRVWGCCRSAE